MSNCGKLGPSPSFPQFDTRPPPVENLAVVELLIERPVAGGWMLARHDGRVVLVSGAVPGERVRARLQRTTRSMAWAETIEVVDPSGDRRQPACDPFCGGALYAHIRYPRQLQLKAEVIADAFRRIGKMALPQPPAVTPSPETAYRLRARLHVRGRRIGFFREGSHEVCDARPTQQLHADALAAADALGAGLGVRLAACDEIVVAENVSATERVLHLVPRTPGALDGLRLSVDRLAGVTGLTVAGERRLVVIDGNPRVSDTAADLFGPDAPVDAGVTWRRQAAAFFQGNRFLIGALVRAVVGAAGGETCLDLYSGVGLFAVALAALGRRVVAVESDPVSAEDLRLNVANYRDQVIVHQASVEAFCRQGVRPPDAIVLDPPRAGVSAEALGGIAASRAARLVYVSCDPPTLARDAAKLSAAGYALESIDAFDLFPNTPHVETVAVFATDRH